jgi:hypothetical protein
MFRLMLLIERDANDHENRGKQCYCLAQISEYDVEQAGYHEKQEHRLAQDFECSRPDGSWPGCGKLIEHVVF